jgi:hypothetical protein
MRLFLALLVVMSVSVSAEWVDGHIKKDGTGVSGYYRTNANSTSFDNKSYKSTAPSTWSSDLAPIKTYTPAAKTEYKSLELPAYKSSTPEPKTEWVNGYFRKDGTYVAGYYRSK